MFSTQELVAIMKILSFEITNSINTDFTKRAGKVLYMMKLNNKNA